MLNKPILISKLLSQMNCQPRIKLQSHQPVLDTTVPTIWRKKKINNLILTTVGAMALHGQKGTPAKLVMLTGASLITMRQPPFTTCVEVAARSCDVLETGPFGAPSLALTMVVVRNEMEGSLVC